MEHDYLCLPPERLEPFHFMRADLPGVGIVNRAWRDVKPRAAFAWQLTLRLELWEVGENGLPSPEELGRIRPFEDFLELLLPGDDLRRPQAFLLGRITWNGTRQYAWRVRAAPPVEAQLQAVREEGGAPRPFGYQLDPDPAWAEAEAFAQPPTEY